MMNIQRTCILSGMMLLFLFSPKNTFGQHYSAINLNNLNHSPGNFNEVVSENEIEEINSLVYDINPTIFIDDSGLKTFGDNGPVKAEFSAGSFEPLKSSNPDFNAVKLLTVKMKEPADFKSSLDLSNLQAFQNLKYVLVECSFDCSLSGIQNLFSNIEDVVILYIVATPE